MLPSKYSVIYTVALKIQSGIHHCLWDTEQYRKVQSYAMVYMIWFFGELYIFSD